MALFLSESDIHSLLSMSDAIETIRSVFHLNGEGKVIGPPRQCVYTPSGVLRITSAAVPSLERMGIKVSSRLIFKSSAGRLFLLMDTENGKVLAIIEVFHLGALRTGAATGVATDYLARRDARVVGIFGSGRQARTQLLAIACTRPIERVLATSRNRSHLNLFCKNMEEQLGLPVVPAESPEEMYEADVLVSATTSQEPVIFGKWLQPGSHINAIGANMTDRRELDIEAVGCSDLVTVDNKKQATSESAELLRAVEAQVLSWERVKEIGEIVSGKSPGRPSDKAITLFKSLGVAMEDVALASRAYELARQTKIGLEIPLTEA